MRAEHEKTGYEHVTPLKVPCELGGWKDATTVLRCYQRPGLPVDPADAARDTYEVFLADGRLHGAVAVPAGARLMDVGDEYVLLVNSDELDVRSWSSTGSQRTDRRLNGLATFIEFDEFDVSGVVVRRLPATVR